MLHPKLISFLPKPIACRALGPFLAKFVEAEVTLTETEREVINAHLADCDACQEEVADMVSLGALLRQRGPVAMPAVQPAPDLWGRLEARMDAEEATAPIIPVREPAFANTNASRRRGAMLVFAPAFAAVVVGIVMVPRLIHTPLSVLSKDTGAAASVPATPPSAMNATEPLAAKVSDKDATLQESPRMMNGFGDSTNHLAVDGPSAPVAGIAPNPARRMRFASNSTTRFHGATVAESQKNLFGLDAVRRQAQEEQAREAKEQDNRLALVGRVSRTPSSEDANRAPFAMKAKSELQPDNFQVYAANGTTVSGARMVASETSKQNKSAATFALDSLNDTANTPAAASIEGPKADPIDASAAVRLSIGNAHVNAHVRETGSIRDADSKSGNPFPAIPSTIRIVETEPGSGVSAKAPVLSALPQLRKSRTVATVGTTASAGSNPRGSVRTSPAEELNRLRQRRGLFGGYGIATSAAMLPAASGGASTIPNTSSPW